MAKYRITDNESGDTFEVEAPDDASETQVMEYFQSNLPKPQEQAAKPPSPGAAASALQGFRQGSTLGFGDEIEGALWAAGSKLAGSDKSISQLYDAGVETSRYLNNAAAETNPVSYYGGQIAGGVAPGVGTGGLGIGPNAAKLGLAARTVRGAKEGAAIGAAAGFGGSEGGVGNRAVGTALGTVVGGVIGAATPGATDIAAATARGLTAPIKGMLAPEKFGLQKYAEATLRDLNPDGMSSRSSRDQSEKVARLRGETGKDIREMDLGGKNVRKLVKLAGSMPGTGSAKLNKFLDSRQGFQWKRIESDLARAVGNPDEYAATLDDTLAKRSAQAAPDFDAAMKQEVPLNEKLGEVLQRPAIQRLIGDVSDNMANEGASFQGLPPMQALHRIKLELDESLSRARRARDMGQSPTAGMDMRTLTILKKDFVNAIDNPAYRTALDNFAGHSALKSALEDGRENFFKMDTEEIGKHLGGLSASEQDMWRLGAARAIAGKNRKGNITHDRTDRDFSSPEMTKRLEALFPDNVSRREFQKRLLLESKMSDSRKAVQGNSSTFEQTLQGEEAGKEVAMLGAVANAATGRLGPMVDMLSRGRNRLTGITPRSAESIINAGMSKGDGQANIAMSNALMQARRAPESRNALASAARGSITAGANPLFTLGDPSKRR